MNTYTYLPISKERIKTAATCFTALLKYQESLKALIKYDTTKEY